MRTINWKWLHSVHRFDVRTFLAINRSPYHLNWSKAARRVSQSADGWLYLLLPIVAYDSDMPAAGPFVAALTLALLTERVVYLLTKNGFKRSRPPQAIPGFSSVITASDEFSFPSGHTSGAFLVATVCCYWLGIEYLWLYPWACLVGASRVLLGVHFPTDILAGAAMGSLMGLMISTAIAG